MSTDIFRDGVFSGKSIATALSRCGATVDICGRRASVLGSAAADIGGDVHWHTSDFRDTDAIDGRRHPAGPGTFADLSAITDGQWRAAREVIRASVFREKTLRSEMGIQA